MGFAFELVSPERVLFSGEATEVVVPASEGEVTLMAGHAPFMSALRSGIVRIDGTKRLFVRGGFADVSESGVTLLAEVAVAVEDIDAEAVAGQIKDAEEDLRDAKTEADRAKATDKLLGLKDMLLAVRQ